VRKAWRPWLWTALVGGGLFAVAFLMYFLVYRTRHFALPLGWDTPWYVWRADYVAELGIGPLGTNARPGHAALSAVLGSLGGLSQLQLQVVFPYVTVGIFALGIGALVHEGLGGGLLRWALTAAVAAVVVGATRLVGENVANLLHVLLVVAGLVFILRWVSVGRGLIAALVAWVAAGLAHWLFLGLSGLALLVWFLIALALRRRREARQLAVTGVGVGVAMAATIYPLLGSSLSTFEIHEAKRRYLPKLREDLANIAWPLTGALAAAGAVELWSESRDSSPTQTTEARGPFLRMLLSWSLVCLGGIAFAALTLRLPPHRFLNLFLAIPAIVAIAAAVWFPVRWLGARGRWPAVAGVAVSIAAILLLAWPGMRVWYGPADLVDSKVVSSPAEGPEQWFDVTAFDQARYAAAYLSDAAIPPERPVIFVVGPTWHSGPISTALKERTIRAAMPPQRQEDVHVYPGDYMNLVDRLGTRTGNDEIDAANSPYWQDAFEVLDDDPVVIAISQLGPEEYGPALEASGGAEYSSGVAILAGPQPDPAANVSIDFPGPVPATELGFLQAAFLLAALGLAGLGWTVWFLGGDRTDPIRVLSLSPAVGCAALMIPAVLVAKLFSTGVGGTTGKLIWVAVTFGGGAVAALSVLRERRQRVEE
jgi:hypothetical protein